MSLGDYPLGARYDRNAPYNEPPYKDVEVCVSVTCHKTVTVNVPDNYDSTDLYDAVRRTVNLPMDFDDTWIEDEVEVIEE